MENLHDRTDALKRNYRKTLEIALTFSLALIFTLLHALPDVMSSRPHGKLSTVKIEVQDIARTYQQRKPAPPQIPQVAVPSECAAPPENVLVKPVSVDLTSLPPTPVRKDPYQEFTFIPHETPPRLRGGLAALHELAAYPQYALDRGIEGTVLIGVLIDERGHPCKVTVLRKADVDVGFEAAATEAVKQSRWYPAEQRDKKVKVWVAVPFYFKIEYRHTGLL